MSDEIYGDPVRNCTRCKGTKVRSYDATRACLQCSGRGTFNAPNLSEIRMALAGRGGKLRSTKPKDNLRAGYVWRMARFHGGKDVTMPVCFMMDVEGDPYIRELDILSDEIARESFGSHFAGALRWGRALGMV